MRLPKGCKEIELRPYNGRLFFVRSKTVYEKAHKILFKTPDVLTCAEEGRFTGGEGKDGMWTYLVWASKPSVLAHEMAHAVFHIFDRCGIDPRDSHGEAFCYMLSQLMLEAS
jgi:hypothetical protein